MVRPEKLTNYFYRGKPATHTCLIAVAWNGDTQAQFRGLLATVSI